jgi:hypothetical protein
MKFTKDTSDNECSLGNCAWFIPPVMHSKEGGCAVYVLSIASMLHNSFVAIGKSPQEILDMLTKANK